MSTAAGAVPGKPRVLCVDDEQQVLAGLTLNLRRKFDVHTALSGAEGLKRFEGGAGFAVVISDMRMPQMSGAAFLATVRTTWPDTTRMLLTGHAEIDAAIAAVNEGQIFRFLAKPCPADKLVAAVDAAVEQYRLVTSERVLLEQTLQGSIKALTDILSLQNPLAFGRATRAKAQITALAQHLALPQRWPLEVAAMLSPIGTVTLPPETVEKLYDGRPLSAAEQVMVRRLPTVTEQLLANIPRLEPVRDILSHLDARFDGEYPPPAPGTAPATPPSNKKGTDLPIGARLLKLILDYDQLESQKLPRPVVLDTMRGRKGLYDPDLFSAFETVLGTLGLSEIVEELPLNLLAPGMVIVDDVRNPTGHLLIARGHEITASLLERIRNVSRNGGVKEPIRVRIPAGLQRPG